MQGDRRISPLQDVADISGILILRHVLMEVIETCQAVGLDHLGERLESELRHVQPKPAQPMRRGRGALSVAGDRRASGGRRPRAAASDPRR